MCGEQRKTAPPGKNMDQKHIAIIGCGRLGKSLAYQLKAAGHDVFGIACHRAESAAKAAELTGINHDSALKLTALAEVIFLTVPDDMLRDVCTWLSLNGNIQPGTIVLHCSGSRPSSILETAKNTGAFIASLHPLQSFSGFNKDINPFMNINFTVEGESQAVNVARELAMNLGAARCYAIDTNGKVLYHAAAVVASNYLVTLFNMAANLLEKAGIAKDDAFTILAPLLNGTLKNLADNAPCYEMALTGPITRGDTQVVSTHLDAMQAQIPATAELYKTMGMATVKIAQNQGTLNDEKAAKLVAILTKNKV